MTDYSNVGHDQSIEVQDCDEPAGFPEQNWFQTLVTVPLLTASAGAVFMLLPAQSTQPVSDGVNAVNTSSFGLALRDPSFRQHQVVVARIENDRQRILFSDQK